MRLYPSTQIFFSMKIHIYLLVLFYVLSLFTPFNVMAAEEPKYELIEKSGDFELRQYHPMLIAEVLVDGNMDQASSKGFRLIADYIFGNNVTKTGDSGKIKMTTPVTIKPKSEKISMTAPVTLEKISDKWRVIFVMPSQYTLNTIPSPNNKRVILREVSGEIYKPPPPTSKKKSGVLIRSNVWIRGLLNQPEEKWCDNGPLSLLQEKDNSRPYRRRY